MGSNDLFFGQCAKQVKQSMRPNNQNDVKYIGLEHIEQGTLHLNGFGWASDVTSIKSEFKKGDILFGKLRPYFRKVIRAPFDGVCSTDIWVVRSLVGIEQDFLFYWMASNDFVEFAMQGSEGTKMPRAKWEHICRHKIPLLSISEQRTIAHILGSLDDKIELNRKMNETLETMAQALFKSWFVDLDPVIDNALAADKPIPDELKARAEQRKNLDKKRKYLPKEIQKSFPNEFVKTNEMGWMPKGWTVESVGELTTELRRGISPKYIEEGGIRVINQRCIRNHFIDYSFSRNHDQTLKKVTDKFLELGDLLINSTGVGTLGRMAQVLYLHESTVADSHVTVVRPDPKKIKPYYFARMMIAIEPIVEGMGQGSTGQTELSRTSVANIKVMVPSPEIQAFTDKLFKHQANKIAENIQLTNTLMKLRDSLLPKLLSGEIRISESEKIVEKML